MDPNNFDSIKKRFDFEAWSGTGRDTVRRNVVLPEKLVGDLRPGSVREIDPGDGTRLLRASWSAPGDDPASVFVDVRECESAEQAHEVVLELLANMQAPDVSRMQQTIGDASFGREDALSLIFVRGNVAVAIRNGGSNVVRVDTFARAIDDWIVGGAS